MNEIMLEENARFLADNTKDLDNDQLALFLTILSDLIEQKKLSQVEVEEQWEELVLASLINTAALENEILAGDYDE